MVCAQEKTLMVTGLGSSFRGLAGNLCGGDGLRFPVNNGLARIVSNGPCKIARDEQEPVIPRKQTF